MDGHEAERLRADIEVLRQIIERGRETGADPRVIQACTDLERERRERLEQVHGTPLPPGAGKTPGRPPRR